MKKTIFITIDSLTTAGAEKSLISFLSVLDYSRFSVDLQLFRYGGAFEQYLPKEVNLLPPFKFTSFLQKSIWRQILSLNISYIFARARYSFLLLIHKNSKHADKARYYWKSVVHCLDAPSKEYDIAIAYAQGVPTFYVVDKVVAKTKFSWINCIYHLEGQNKQYQRRFYSSIDRIVLVSEEAMAHLKKVYPIFVKKMFIIADIVNPQMMRSMSENGESFIDGYKGTRLLTVARLNKPQKGYDITIEACKLLRDRGLAFKWYAIGKGPYRSEIEAFINQNNLQDYFVLLGTTPNPYPYYKQATIYVQTSRHEGYGLSIAEARMLNIPVVTTEFDAVYSQMVPGKNGLVVPQDPVLVADAIEQLMNDKVLYNSIVQYQKQEKKGNVEEIEKFYKLIES